MSTGKRAVSFGQLMLSVMVLANIPLAARGQVFQPQPTGSLARPWFPPRGEWLQVLTATDKWLVLQNESGQQFPVAYDAVQNFVMRWPTSLDRIGPTDLVEVTGLNLGTNRIGADHIDIYRGSARAMVAPLSELLYGYNRSLTFADIERQIVYGINFQYLLTPEEMQMPLRWHVVAPAARIQPLQLMVGGNNVVSIISSPTGMTMSEVTRGVVSFVQAGDMAYVVPLLDQSGPRSVVLAHLIVYKNVFPEQLAR